LARRSTHYGSALLLKELYAEDPAEYRACLRMSPECHHAGILNTQIALLQPKQIICTDLLVAHCWQVGVHMRQVKGRFPADIDGRRQAATKIELPSIYLPCLADCQATCLASKFQKVNSQTGN
jgi:hypothetical protein